MHPEFLNYFLAGVSPAGVPKVMRSGRLAFPKLSEEVPGG